MIVALFLILVVSVLLSAARQEQVENLLPCVVLAVISVLFPLYCFNQLFLGHILVYVLMAAVLVWSGFVLLRQGNGLNRLCAVLSPGLALYVCLCAFALLYTKDNLVGLWDELRLWAAVPKAMYMTEQLQVGTDALVFPIMQPYPPGMPLLVYFMTALSPVFNQAHIFAVYGILFFTLLLPCFRNLRWGQWRILPVVFVLTALLPCVLTSHGGDFGWFYESLFIDPILGAAAGYAFYLAWSKPFESRFSAIRFEMALLVLTILKDSGAMFALVAAACAAVVHLAEEKKWGRALLHGVDAVLPVVFGYGLWNRILKIYGVSNNMDNFMNRLPPRSSLGALWKQLSTQPMAVFEGPFFRSNLTLTYFPCLLILMGISIYAVCRMGKKAGKSTALTWLAMLGAAGLFFLGYIISYHNAVPSFQRYTGSTLICMAVFTLLQSVPVLFRDFRKLRRGTALLLAVVTLCSGVTLIKWREKKWDIEYAQKHAVPAISRILDVVEGEPANSQDIYLLVSETPASFSMAHHRTYFELLGSPAVVRNFWNDTNVVGGDKTPEIWTQEEMDAIAAKWQDKLQAGGYDYIYLMTLNEFTTAVLTEFGISDPVPGDVLAIGWQNENMIFTKAEISPDALPVENAG